MNKTKTALLMAAICSLALVGFALYLQHAKDMLPCPLCVIQRYAFILLAIACFISAFSKKGIFIGLIAGIIGAGTASYQLYVIANPEIKCGVDPIQVAVNKLYFADWLPSVFYAEGSCGTYYDPILGLSIPEWSLAWFVMFILLLVVAMFKAK